MKIFSRRCDTGGQEGFGRGGRVLFALAALLVVLGAAASGFPAEKGFPARKMLEPGASAPGFAVKDAAGEPFDFGAENGRSASLVVFFSIFCEPCRRELAVAQRLQDRYRDAGWRVVGVSLDGPPLSGAVEGFARQEGYTYRILMDEPDAQDMFRVADLFGVSGIPSTFVIEKGGRVALSRRGPVMEEELEKLMRPGRKP
jgi:peroxiredoxin